VASQATSAASAPAAGSAEEVVRSYFAAVAARDPEAMARHWAPDGVEDIVAVGIFRGPDEVREFFAALFAALPDAETVVEQVVAEGGTAVVRWRMAGTFTGGPLLGLEPTGRRIELRGADVLEVAGGLIERNTAYYDGMAMARGIGLLPPQDSGAEKALFAVFNAVTKIRSTVRERAAR
jgi:steroid delta-isomerase-like uncharacterized protein